METRNKILIFIFAFVLLLSGVSSLCNETQVDINTANLTELMKIKGLGGEGIIAGRVIDYRQTNIFNSLDELVNVSGIGNLTLSKIKAQGLACVSSEIQSSSESETEEPVNASQEASNAAENTEPNEYLYNPPKKTQTITLTPIALNIKSEENKEILKKNLALAGIITFCIGFGALFFLRATRRRRENEFR